MREFPIPDPKSFNLYNPAFTRMVLSCKADMRAGMAAEELQLKYSARVRQEANVLLGGMWPQRKRKDR